MTYDKELYVCYFASNYFVEQCGVSIISLLENNKDTSIGIFVIEKNFTESDKNKFEQISNSYKQSIEFIKMPEPENFFGDDRFTLKSIGNSYSRMILGKILPSEVGSVLCLDSDTLVLGSLSGLCDIENFKDYYIAGVDDAAGEAVMIKQLKIVPQSLYCNGRVLLFNLDKIRRDRLEDRYVSYIKTLFDQHMRLVYYEEEVINKCASPYILRLSADYNVVSPLILMGYDAFVRFRGIVNDYYTKEETDIAIQNPKIVHAINTFYVRKQIWEKNSDSPYANEYVYYRSLSPWSELPQIETKYSMKQKLMKQIWHIMPRKIAFFVASYVRNNVRPCLQKQRDDE